MPRNLWTLACLCLLTSSLISLVQLSCDRDDASYDYDGYEGYEAVSSNQLQKDLAKMGVTIDAPDAFDTSPGPVAYTKVTGEIRPTLAGKHDPTLVAFVNGIEVLDAEGVSIAKLERFGDGKFSIDVVRGFIGEEISLKVSLIHWGDHFTIDKPLSAKPGETIDFGAIDFAIEKYHPSNEYVFFKGKFSHPAMDKANLDGMDINVYPSSEKWRVVNGTEADTAMMTESGVFWILQDRNDYLRDGWYMQDDRIPNIGYSFTEDRKASMRVGKKHDGYFELSQIPYPGKLFSLEIEGVLPEPLRWHDQTASDSRSKALPSDFHRYLKPNLNWTESLRNTNFGRNIGWYSPRYTGKGRWLAQAFSLDERIKTSVRFECEGSSYYNRSQDVWITASKAKPEAQQEAKVPVPSFIAIRAEDPSGKSLREFRTEATFPSASTNHINFPDNDRSLNGERISRVYAWMEDNQFREESVMLVWNETFKATAFSVKSRRGVVSTKFQDAWEGGTPPTGVGYPDSLAYLTVTVYRGKAKFADDARFQLVMEQIDEDGSSERNAKPLRDFSFGKAKSRTFSFSNRVNVEKASFVVLEPTGKVGFPNTRVSERKVVPFPEEGGKTEISIFDKTPYPTSTKREYIYRVRCGPHLLHPHFEFYEGGGYREVEGAFHSTHFIDRLTRHERNIEFTRTSATEFEAKVAPNLEIHFTQKFRDAFEVRGLGLSWASLYLPDEVEKALAYEVVGTKQIHCGIGFKKSGRTAAYTTIAWKAGKGVAIFDEPPYVVKVAGANHSLHWYLHDMSGKEVGWSMSAGRILSLKPGKCRWVGKFRDEVLYQSEPFEVGKEKITTLTIPSLETTRAYEAKAKAKKD